MDLQQIAELEASAADARKKAEENPEDEALQTAAQKAETELSKAKVPPQPKKKEFTPLEKAIFARKKIDEQIEKLQAEGEDEEDDRPVTVGMLKKMEADKAQKTALQLADNIEDESEREEVKTLLQNSIKPSGNAEQDLRNALAIANSRRNAQIAEELARKVQPKSHSSAPGSPGKPEDRFEPTPNEAVFMKPPYNMTKEDIIKARQKTAAQQ